METHSCKFVRTHDLELINSILTDESVFRHITDDGDGNNIPNIIHPKLYWVLAYHNNELLGLFFIHPNNFITYEIHTCLLPNSYGHKARSAAKGVIGWVFTNTDCLKLVTTVPEYNSLALQFAKRSGLKQEGVNRKSFLRNKILMDQYILGITKEEYLCQ